MYFSSNQWFYIFQKVHWRLSAYKGIYNMGPVFILNTSICRHFSCLSVWDFIIILCICILYVYVFVYVFCICILYICFVLYSVVWNYCLLLFRLFTVFIVTNRESLRCTGLTQLLFRLGTNTLLFTKRCGIDRVHQNIILDHYPTNPALYYLISTAK